MKRSRISSARDSGADLRLSHRVDEPDETVGGFRDGSGTPLVMLHPAMTSWRAWRPLLPGLVPHHDVLALTLTGHRGGPRRDPGRALTLAMFGDHVERSLDRLGIGTAHFVGNSVGGLVSLDMVKRGRARSATAISPPAVLPNIGAGARVIRVLAALQRLAGSPALSTLVRAPRVRRMALLPAMEHGDRVSCAELASGIRDIRCARILREIWIDARTVGSIDLPDLFGVPVLIAWAERDRVVPWDKFAVPLMPLIPQAEFRVLAGVGHVPMWDNPTLLVNTILEVTGRAEQRLH